MTWSMIKGFHCIIQRFQTRFSDVRVSIQQKDGLTSFLYVEAKTFNVVFWKDIMSEKITVIDHQTQKCDYGD